MLPLRTILHPTDFSELAGHALKLAFSLARDYNARLIVLHVVPPPLMAYAGTALLPDRKDALESVRQRLDDLTIPRPEDRLERRFVEGDPVTEILRACEEFGADLIVMGASGRGGLERLFLGSVADNVIRQTSCPVMLVRHPVPELASAPAAPVAEAIELCPP